MHHLDQMDSMWNFTLEHGTRLEKIQRNWKLVAKLTAIIRNFWWTGIKAEPTTKIICLRAWKDICIPKCEGGLGIRNIQAMNRGLILSAAWRIAENPDSFLFKVLKSKYHPDTSIWRANSNIPKSAFWSSILKVRHILCSNSFIQILDGNSSIWSTPWFSHWQSIYDHLIIQPRHYNYPSQVKDLWIPDQKAWNANLIYGLFDQQIADSIMQVPIIMHEGPNILCWKPHSSGKCTSKSAYKVCMQDMQQQGEPSPRQVQNEIKQLLKQVWKEKGIAPRVQTFAWRLLRKAIPTGMRAGKYSSHIKKHCSRCDQEENDMHLFLPTPLQKLHGSQSYGLLKQNILLKTMTLCMP